MFDPKSDWEECQSQQEPPSWEVWVEKKVFMKDNPPEPYEVAKAPELVTQLGFSSYSDYTTAMANLDTLSSMGKMV